MKSRPETRNETSRRCWRASSRGSTKTSKRATSSRTMTWASPSRRWGCWTRRSQSCRKRCGRRTENCGAQRRWACASSTRAPTSSRSRSCGARSTCRPPVIRSAWVSCTGWAARSRSQAAGATDPRAVTLAAVVELIHLATLVHDDSVDHSVLRRGMPTLNALFSHQVAVIMGDYLYSRAIIELVRLDDREPLRVFARVTNEMTIGEMRQLEAHDKLAYSEEQYDH